MFDQLTIISLLNNIFFRNSVVVINDLSTLTIKF